MFDTQLFHGIISCLHKPSIGNNRLFSSIFSCYFFAVIFFALFLFCSSIFPIDWLRCNHLQIFVYDKTVTLGMQKVIDNTVNGDRSSVEIDWWNDSSTARVPAIITCIVPIHWCNLYSTITNFCLRSFQIIMINLQETFD